QADATPERVAAEAAAYLDDPARSAGTRACLARGLEDLGPPGAPGRTADALVAALAAVLAMLGVALFTGLVTYLFGPLFDQVLTPVARTAVMAHAGAAPGLGSVVGEKSVVRRTAVAKALDGGLAS